MIFTLACRASFQRLAYATTGLKPNRDEGKYAMAPNSTKRSCGILLRADKDFHADTPDLSAPAAVAMITRRFGACPAIGSGAASTTRGSKCHGGITTQEGPIDPIRQGTQRAPTPGMTSIIAAGRAGNHGAGRGCPTFRAAFLSYFLTRLCGKHP